MGMRGDLIGAAVGGIKGDTRSVDYSSYIIHVSWDTIRILVCFWATLGLRVRFFARHSLSDHVGSAALAAFPSSPPPRAETSGPSFWS